MASGNFAVGEGLSLQAFDKYVLKALNNNGFTVEDKVVIPYKMDKKSILISLVGKGDLEKALNEILISAGMTLDAEMKNQKQDQQLLGYQREVSEYSHSIGKGERAKHVHKGIFETKGIYNDNKTASLLFPAMAQDFLLKDVKYKLNEVKNEIKQFLQKKVGSI